MKKIGITLLVAGIAAGTWAKPVPEQAAKTAALNFISGKMSHTAVQLQLHSRYGSEAQPAVYVFTVREHPGFVLVSGDDLVQPILGYSAENRLAKPSGALSPELNYWIEGYASQIDAVRIADQPARKTITDAWERLLTGQPEPVAQKTTTVSPLLTTKWDQSPYYNIYCPTINNSSSHAPTGCVATAMAQIMKYWDYPTQGTGSHTYNTSTLGGTLSADFGNTTYNWQSMPDMVTSSSTSAQLDAVALLMSHCGIAVDMDYGPSASGSYVVSFQPFYDNANAEDALKTYFGYAASLHGEVREDYSDPAWLNMLETELDNGRPILYAGYGGAGGHAFVFDGYDSDQKFHINWGWSGYGNGYYTADNLEPTFVGTGGGIGNFNDGQMALFGVVPGATILQLTSNYVASADSIPYNSAYTLSTQLTNSGAADFTSGLLALIAVNNSTNQEVLLDSFRTTIASGATFTFDFATSGHADLVPGTYSLVYKSADGQEPLTEVGDGVVANGSQQLTVYEATPTAIVSSTDEAIRIYPNPVSDILFVQAEKSETRSLALIDVTGKIIWQTRQPASLQKINVATLPAGIYFLSVHTRSGQFQQKIYIRH